MHRVLLIQAGHCFDGLVAALISEENRRTGRSSPAAGAGSGDDLELRALRAPMEGTGHLQRPVALLRERLEAELADALAELFRLRSAPGTSELLLDLVVLVDLGQPMAARASMIAMDAVVELLDDRYNAIFPAHRRGSDRRVRGFVFALLPAAEECARTEGAGAREAARAGLQELHAGLSSRRDTAHSRQWPADRLFVLDAVTSRGIVALADLCDQLHLFLRCLLFTGLRRHPTMLHLLEAPGSDLVATFGCAGLVLDRDLMQSRLGARLSAAIGAALSRREDAAMPSGAELAPTRALWDDAALEHALTEIASTPARILDIDGPAAVAGLARHFDELCARLNAWDQAGLVDQPADRAEALAISEPTVLEPTVLEPNRRPTLATIAGLSIALGLGVFAAAHLALDLAAFTGAGLGLGFAVLGALVLGVLARRQGLGRDGASGAGAGEEARARAADREAAAQRLGALQAAAAAQGGRLGALCERLAATSHALTNAQKQPGPTAPPARAPIFVAPITAEPVVEALYARANPYASAGQATDALLASLGGWEVLLREPTRVDARAVDAFGRAAFAPLLTDAVLDQPSVRGAAEAELDAFVSRWRAGVPLALECENRKHFDPDGMRLVLDQCLIAAPHIQPLLAERIDARGSCVRLGPAAEGFDDVLLIHACTDIHHDAFSPTG